VTETFNFNESSSDKTSYISSWDVSRVVRRQNLENLRTLRYIIEGSSQRKIKHKG